MRSALIFAALLLPQPPSASGDAPLTEHQRLLKANGIEPTPAGVLGYIRPYSSQRLKELVQEVGDDSYAKREDATKRLSAMPVPVGPLFAAAQSPDPERRYRAHIVLKQIRKALNSDLLLAAFKTMRSKAFAQGAPAVLGMIPQLQNESLIAAATEALGSIAQPEHFELLRAALRQEKHVRTRLVALQALTRMAGEKIVDDLKRLVKEDNEQIQMAAAAALVNLKRRESLEVLAKLLGSQDVAIRAGAVRYLRNITGQRFGFVAIDNSPARDRAAQQWTAWVSQHGATAKLNLDPQHALTASPKLSLNPELLHKITGHNSTVYCVAFSPDGKRLASSSGDGTMKLWNVADGKLVWGKSGHGGATIRSIVFSPDGKLLATGSYDKTVKLWNANAGSEIRTLRGHKQSVRLIAFSHDGKWLATGGDEGTVIVWEVASGKAVQNLTGHTATVRTVAFAPDDNRVIASAGSDETIRLWDRESGKLKHTLEGHKASVRSVAFSPDGGTLASCGLDNTVRLWDVKSGRQRVILGRHSLSVKSLVYSPDGRFIASGGNDRVVNVWDADSGQIAHKLTGPTSHIWHVAISKDGKLLSACGSDRSIFLWKLDAPGSSPRRSDPPTVPAVPKPDVPEPAKRP